MPIHIKCECRKVVVAPDHVVGSWVTCPHCGKRVEVTVRSVPPAPPRPAPRTPRVFALDGGEDSNDDIVLITPEPELTYADPDPEPVVAKPKRLRPQELGYEADDSKRASAFWLGVLCVLIAFFSCAPAFIVLVSARHSIEPTPIPMWVYLMIFTSLLHFCMGLYVAQLADWSSVWVVTGFGILFTAVYAMLCAVCMLGLSDNSLLAILQLNDESIGTTRKVGWCAIMMLCNSMIAYVAARSATRWVRAYKVLSLENVNVMP